MAFDVIATDRFANQLRNAPGELTGYVSAVAAVLRVNPTVASAAFDVVRSGEEEYTAIFAHGRGFQVEARYCGWFREPLDPPSPEIVTVARSRGG